jgi:hypothetical protein
VPGVRLGSFKSDVLAYHIWDIRGFSLLTQTKKGDGFEQREELLGWEWWAGHQVSSVD